MSCKVRPFVIISNNNGNNNTIPYWNITYGGGGTLDLAIIHICKPDVLFHSFLIIYFIHSTQGNMFFSIILSLGTITIETPLGRVNEIIYAVQLRLHNVEWHNNY
jgi:hypothetical protein